MKQKMADLHQKMESQHRQNERPGTHHADNAAKPQPKTVAGDYIDYEEIK